MRRRAARTAVGRGAQAVPIAGRQIARALGAAVSVVIVGAGPAGLSLALALSRHGVATVVHERREQPTPVNESRALTVMPAGMRFFTWLGVADELHGHGQLRAFHEFWSRRRKLLTLDFRPYGGVCDVPQPVVERILRAACE